MAQKSKPAFPVFYTPQPGATEDVAEAFNQMTLVELREVSPVTFANGQTGSVSRTILLQVCPRGLAIITCDSCAGLRGLVWLVGPTQALDLLQSYGTDTLKLALAKTEANFEEIDFSPLEAPGGKQMKVSERAQRVALRNLAMELL